MDAKTRKALNEMLALSFKDKRRLLQCIFCGNNPDTCGCTEKDEDAKGYCTKYKERKNGN